MEAGQTAPFLGQSAAAHEVRRLIGRAARVDTPVLVTGESGTGKELVARAIHRESARSDRSFVPVNCSAIPETLVESELFGHERGAFTGARERRRGVFELADRGVLFLDEIGELGLPAQPKLLRVLESGELRAVGGESELRVDVRVVAATHRDLKVMVRDGGFREDLYYRLRVFTIHVPPLRERMDDLPLLAAHFAERFARRLGRPFTRISDEALGFLARYSFPGNVRELKSVVERAMAMHSGHLLDLEAFDVDQLSSPGLGRLLDKDWETARAEFQAAYARHQLQRHGGDVKKAARAAGLATGSLYKILRRLGLRTRAGPEDLPGGGGEDVSE